MFATFKAAKTAFVAAYEPTLRAALVQTRSTVKVAEAADGTRKLFTVPIKETRKASAFAKATYAGTREATPLLAKQFARRIAYTAIILEAIDGVEDYFDRRARNKRIEEIIAESVAGGMTPEMQEEISILMRSMERRSFGQWVRDIPHRTARRIKRLFYVEIGWWYMVVTSPIWVVTGLLDLLWSFLVVPVTAVVTATLFHREINVEAWVRKPKKVVGWILGHTVLLGYRIFAKGVAMRLYNKTATMSNTESYVVLNVVKDEAHKKIATIIDGRTAFMWGEAFAEALYEMDLPENLRQKATVQMRFWAETNLAAQYVPAVMAGFRTGTPYSMRDMAMAA